MMEKLAWGSARRIIDHAAVLGGSARGLTKRPLNSGGAWLPRMVSSPMGHLGGERHASPPPRAFLGLREGRSCFTRVRKFGGWAPCLAARCPILCVTCVLRHQNIRRPARRSEVLLSCSGLDFALYTVCSVTPDMLFPSKPQCEADRPAARERPLGCWCRWECCSLAAVFLYTSPRVAGFRLIAGVAWVDR